MATLVQPSFGPSPEFLYLPSGEIYQKESKRFQEKAQTVKSLPEGFPQVVSSPLAWKSPAIKQEKSSWTFKLTDDQLKSIDTAVQRFEGKNLHNCCLSMSYNSRMQQPADGTSRTSVLRRSGWLRQLRLFSERPQRRFTMAWASCSSKALTLRNILQNRI